MIAIDIFAPPSRTKLSVDDALAAAEAAARAWSAKGVPRLGPRIASSDLTSITMENARNTLIVRTDRWCPLDRDGPCYPTEQQAWTRPYTRPAAETAEVIEADIEVNAVNFDFSEGERGRLRLQALLVHEFGHVLGLGHSCTSQPARSKHRRTNPCTQDSLTAAMYPTLPQDPAASC